MPRSRKKKTQKQVIPGMSHTAKETGFPKLAAELRRIAATITDERNTPTRDSRPAAKRSTPGLPQAGKE